MDLMEGNTELACYICCVLKEETMNNHPFTPLNFFIIQCGK